MIAIRSENSTSKERSWVMKRIEKPRLVFEILDLLHDFLLHDDVERGCRLVQDHHRRIEGQGHRDHRALAHAAGKLVRVGFDPLGVDPDDLEQLFRALPGSWPGAGRVVRSDDIDHLIADRS